MMEIKSQLVLSTECLLGRYQLKHGSLHIHKNGHQEVYLNLYRAWSDTVSLIPASQKFSATILVSQRKNWDLQGGLDTGMKQYPNEELVQPCS